MLFPRPAEWAAATIAWLTIGAGDVRKARRDEDDPKRPLRQSWVLMTRDPSAHMIDAMIGVTVGIEAMVEDRLGRLTVKLAIADETEDVKAAQSS